MAPHDTPRGRGEADDDVATWPMGRLLSTAARLVEHEWNAALARHDLTHAGLLTLHALAGGPHTQRELAALSYVEEQTMSRVLDRLERSGFATRERDARDRRRLLVQITPRGEAAYRAAVDSGTADALVGDRVADPQRFRADLVGMVRRLLADHGSGRDDRESGVRRVEGGDEAAHGT